MKNARIYSYTIVYSSTEALKDKTPYLAAIVEKPDGEKVSAMVEGYTPEAKVAIGSEVAFSRQGDGGASIYKLLG